MTFDIREEVLEILFRRLGFRPESLMAFPWIERGILARASDYHGKEGVAAGWLSILLP